MSALSLFLSLSPLSSRPVHQLRNMHQAWFCKIFRSNYCCKSKLDFSYYNLSRESLTVIVSNQLATTASSDMKHHLPSCTSTCFSSPFYWSLVISAGLLKIYFEILLHGLSITNHVFFVPLNELSIKPCEKRMRKVYQQRTSRSHSSLAPWSHKVSFT